MTKKPGYQDPAGLEGDYAAVPSQPPFIFRNVNVRIFPIKANMARLGFFVHQYLNNDIPPAIAHFRPALPYVYLLTLHYGSLEPGTIEARNIGWISQNEVVFSIPLEWWRDDGSGRVVFHDWACVNPFIFVDDDTSLTTGREVYGWPKVKAEFLEEAPRWAVDPRSPTRLLNLKTKLFPKLFAGVREEERELLQIHRDPPLSFSQIPLDPWNPWFPLTALQTAAAGWMDVMGNALDIIAGLPIRGYRAGRDPSTLLRMLCKAGRRASHILPNLCRQGPRDLNTDQSAKEAEPPELKLTMMTLKQFYNPEKPFDACYQAIVGSDIALDSVNRMGLLGDENQLRGDPSGGFTIRIYHYDAQPIVDKLGLQALRVEKGGQAGVSVSIFKPTFPFWADTDLYYGRGQVICSRPTLDNKGKIKCPQRDLDDDRMIFASWERPKTQSDPTTKSAPKIIKAKKDKDPPIPYNTVRGGATQPIAGPFEFPDVTVQVYGLEANDDNRLKEFLDRYLNDTLGLIPDGWKMKFEPWGSFVYLMVSIYGDELGKMYSDSTNIGSWVEKEVSVCVPVNWYKNGEKVNWGIIRPFLFGNTGRAVISDREINGRPTVMANINSFSDVWLNPSGPDAKRELLRLDTEIYPGRFLAQRAENRTLIEIIEGPNQDERSNGNIRAPSTDTGGDQPVASEILNKPQTINFVHLKQHRDAHEVKDLCYQALVNSKRNITQIHTLTPIKNPINIRIHRYPGRPIAELLGLKGGRKDSTGENAVEIFQAKDPFWMRVSVEEPLGEIVCYRLNNQPWVVFEEAVPYMNEKQRKTKKAHRKRPKKG
ncbi:hypothetical protein [Candidatus Nitrospira allomarina]|jgi:hypothetical protein|uniref:Uncharacterized protein n=1 Tax=Candidatus Nitrospira allomarina TaxID=3020900 RepID=A0AA96GAS7_9BACT|nr:hypothetical protein [Candidatus Nitrospira allomarina]WNM58614.1 hypothetical protein PP769_02275 [Candidatus Nitrospira allomarina]